jgi:surface carbohydrate biosynthesis protein
MFTTKLKLPKPVKGPIYLPVETIARELDGKLLLAAEVARRGYGAIIGSKGACLRIAKKIRQGVWYDKGYGDHYVGARFKRLCRVNIHCTAIDEEGFVILDSKAYLKNRGINSGVAFRYLDSIFVWGEHQNSIIATFDCTKGKLLVTGNPRFDLYQPRFRSYFSKKIKALHDVYGRYLLVNTNFAAGNYARSYKSSYLDGKIALGIIKCEEDLNFYKAWRDYKESLLKEYCVMVIKLAETLPGINIVVRPHPGEELSTWVNQLKGIDNIHVCREGSASDWILGAEAVIHSGCTTGIEAVVAEIPVLRYHPIYDPRYESAFSNSFGEGASDLSDLIFKARRIIEEKRYTANRQPLILKHHLNNSSASWAYENIADEFVRLFTSNPNPKMISSISQLGGLSEAKVALRSIIRYFSGNQSVAKSVHNTQKFPGLYKDDLEGKLELLLGILEDKNCTRMSDMLVVRQLAKDAFGVFPV